MSETSPRFAFARRARKAVDQPISYLMAHALENPDLISLAAGFVDYDTLPASETKAIFDEILSDPASSRAALQYGTTQGLPPLRTALYDHMAKLDGSTPSAYPGSASDVIVTSGSQQLLHILTDLLIDEDDIVITASPSYFVYTGVLAAAGATVRTVAMDEQGMQPASLDNLLGALDKLGQLSRVKMVYVQTYHQNPTGITLAPDRRGQILDIVRKYSRSHRILLLEDAAYRELNYDQSPPLSIKSLDTDNQHVALLQTFSKPFAPGVKTGYGLLPSDLIEPACLSKGGRDFGSANLCQHLLLRAMQTGIYAKHVERLNQAYAEKCHAMLDALDKHMTGETYAGTHWTKPVGGLYVWLTLPDSIDTGRHGPLFSHAINEGVLFVPGEYCYPADPVRTAPNHTIRLSFGVPSVEQIQAGIARLAAAIAKVQG